MWNYDGTPYAKLMYFPDVWLVKQFLHICWQLDWAKSWWVKSLWDSTSLIIFWSCSAEFLPFPALWLVKQFLHIYRQTNDGIKLKFGGLWDSPCLWLVEQFLHSCRQTAASIKFKFGGLTNYMIIQAWYNIGWCFFEFPWRALILGWGLLKLRSLISP